MIRFLPLVLALMQPVPDDAAKDAKAIAQDILTKGAALFDTHDAAAMAATYTENAEILLYTKENEGSIKVDSYHGRAEIKEGYAKIFRATPDVSHARNVVEAAHFIGPDTLAINRTFHFQTDKDNTISFSFIQVRVKQGDAWRILHLQSFVFAEK